MGHVTRRVVKLKRTKTAGERLPDRLPFMALFSLTG